MNKIAASVLVMLMTTLGLVAVTSQPANSAVCTRYAGCVETRTKASGPKVVVKKKRPIVCGRTKAVGSNAKPSGKMRFVVKRNRGGYSFATTVPYYGGKKVCIRAKKVKKTGGYTTSVSFIPLNKSIFNPSTGASGFDVVR